MTENGREYIRSKKYSLEDGKKRLLNETIKFQGSDGKWHIHRKRQFGGITFPEEMETNDVEVEYEYEYDGIDYNSYTYIYSNS